MQKLKAVAIASAFIVTMGINSFAAGTHSGQALEESGQALKHAGGSVGHGVIASGQVTSAASAVPLAIGGSAGAVSARISKDLMDAATAPIGTPLEVTDESVTAGPPPNEALSPAKAKKTN